MIPKTIHYCWFGGNPLGEKEKACIQSWERFLPDCEIKRWDESNFDIQCCDYVFEAYEAKKWAFVSDFARFFILYQYGGLYFDTDVEIIRPIDDILSEGPFMGFERDYDAPQGPMAVNPGLGIGATTGLSVYETILKSYKSSHFRRSDGSVDETTVVRRVTDILAEMGLEERPGIQHVAGLTIYPSEFFNPKDFLTGQIHITENTKSIHHYEATWLSDAQKEILARKYTFLEKHSAMSPKVAAALARVGYGIRHGDFGPLIEGIKKNLSR